MAGTLADRPRFGLPGRIQAPNSRRRSIALVGLGRGGSSIAQRVREGGAVEADVRVFCAPGLPREDQLAAIKSNGDDLHRALHEADMIFIAAAPGDEVGLVSVVSRIARDRHAPVTAIYVLPEGMQLAESGDPTLKALRAGVEVLAIANDETYVAALVAALGG